MDDTLPGELDPEGMVFVIQRAGVLQRMVAWQPPSPSMQSGQAYSCLQEEVRRRGGLNAVQVLSGVWKDDPVLRVRRSIFELSLCSVTICIFCLGGLE